MDKIKKYLPYIIGIIVIVLVVFFAYRYHNEQLAKVQILTVEQAQDINALQNKLKVSKQEASDLQERIKLAQQNTAKPNISYVVQAPSIDKATDKVAEHIKNKDPTLPAEALTKTDRTVVAPQPDNQDYQVGVYKINLDKSVKIKLGGSCIDSKAYINAGVQIKRVEVIAHADSGLKIKGATVMWTAAEW